MLRCVLVETRFVLVDAEGDLLRLILKLELDGLAIEDDDSEEARCWLLALIGFATLASF